MRFNDKGQEVREVQEALIGHGYSLPKYGVDGHLGEETWDALHRFAQDRYHKLTWCPEVPHSAIIELMNEVDRPVVPPPAAPVFPNVEVIDLRGEQSNPPPMAKKFKLSQGLVVERNPAMVTGITIHQTAVKYSVKDYQVQQADGDVKLALAFRSLNVACHMMAFHDGFVAWPNPLTWYVYHGNGFNSYELGLEIDGNYPGLIGGQTWNKKPPTEVTPAVVAAACAAIELMTNEGRKLGMPIQYIHAHRQSSATRRSDPGEELWKRVVLDFAVPKLGLIPHQSFTLKDGRPIPKEWDQNGVGQY